MDDRDDLRAALCIVVAAGRIAAIGAAAVLAEGVPAWPILAGLVRRDRALQAAATAERARLAREMHDSLSKTIDALALGAAALPQVLGEPDRATRLAHTLRDGSLVAARDARALIEELRTPAAFQVAEEVPRICREWTAAHGVPVEVRMHRADLAPPVAAELVWILREALRNTARHARASRVRVTLAGHPDRATLTVEDDGVGLAVVPEPAQLLQAGHHGLVGMAERARVCGGSLVVDLSPIGGTRIAASVPRNVAAASTALPMHWRIGATAAVAASCGVLVVALSTTPHPPPSVAAALPSPSPFQAPSTSPTPSPALACRVKYAKQSEWTPGFVADITVTNTGREPIDGWLMTFSYTAGQKMANGWNAIVSQNGATITAEAASGNTRIAPGGSMTFGLQGTWNGRNPVPASFVLNGVRCATPY
jgi:Cellulose binding domain/Histidine kinase